MDACATHEPVEKSSGSRFRSRLGALIWFFRKSRDLWKRKYQELRAALKRERNQVAAVTRSREQWRAKAEQAIAERAAVQQENEALRVQVQQLEDREKKRNHWSGRSYAGSTPVLRK